MSSEDSINNEIRLQVKVSKERDPELHHMLEQEFCGVSIRNRVHRIKKLLLAAAVAQTIKKKPIKRIAIEQVPKNCLLLPP